MTQWISKGKGKKVKHIPLNSRRGVRKRKEPFEVKKTEGVPQSKLIQMQRADVGRRKHDHIGTVAKLKSQSGEDVVLAMDETETFRPVTDPQARQRILEELSKAEVHEWEHTVGSEVVKVKHELLDGRPITTVRFANGEEWFEFESFDHQEEFLKENKINVDESAVGEFVKIDHPIISGYITSESGSVLFGEREDVRKKRDTSFQDSGLVVGKAQWTGHGRGFGHSYGWLIPDGSFHSIDKRNIPENLRPKGAVRLESGRMLDLKTGKIFKEDFRGRCNFCGARGFDIRMGCPNNCGKILRDEKGNITGVVGV